jgi:hypothetical protein
LTLSVCLSLYLSLSLSIYLPLSHCSHPHNPHRSQRHSHQLSRLASQLHNPLQFLPVNLARNLLYNLRPSHPYSQQHSRLCNVAALSVSSSLSLSLSLGALSLSLCDAFPFNEHILQCCLFNFHHTHIIQNAGSHICISLSLSLSLSLSDSL